MNAVTIYVPRDSAALALGAERVAQRMAHEARSRGLNVHIVRNGSRGLFWLEPLVEVATPAGRIGYGPVTENQVPRLFDAGFLTGGA
ncbi:MAG: formate dehydrogenase, partial [Burkholderiaceae bacterium]|nr:formate dehydrogenase [Burkholderiaceae bacterium]